MCEGGVATWKRSSGPSPMPSIQCVVAARSDRWVWRTALGMPVVPELKTSRTSESGSTLSAASPSAGPEPGPGGEGEDVVGVEHGIGAEPLGEQIDGGAVGHRPADAGQGQGVVDLGGLPHGAEQHGGGASGADGVDRDHELGPVARHHRHPVAGPHADRGQVGGQQAAPAVQIGEGPAVVIRPDGDLLAVAGGRGAEGGVDGLGGHGPSPVDGRGGDIMTLTSSSETCQPPAMAEHPQEGADGLVLVVEEDGPVRIVVLNRPASFNAADESLHHRLAEVWTELDADPAVGAIVLTGAGKAFSGGGDLDLLDRMVTDVALRQSVMDEAVTIVRSMTSVRVPIVAAVNGPAVGLGCSLSSMCDVVLIEEQAYFADPHVALGLVAADGGALTWPLLTSLLRAKEYLLTGDRLPAAEAVTLGLANRVVPTGESRSEAVALAHRLAALPPQSVRETKALLNRAVRAAVESVLQEAVDAETASFDEPAFRANLAGMLERTRKA